MAGIGFELRKAIQQDSPKKKLSGYLGAAFSASGSMLVGIILFVFIQLGAKITDVQQNITDNFMCYVTNTMFFSMIVVSFISLLLSRYVSNNIYEEKYEKVMPSLFGSSMLISVFGGTVFCFFMHFSKLSIYDSALLLFLYLVLSFCWLLTTYLTLIRNYKWVVYAYGLAFIISGVFLTLICLFSKLNLLTMVLVLATAFSVVDIVLFRAIYRCFPNQDGSYFEFLKEIKTSPALIFVGFFMMLGMLGHFWMTWFTSSESVIATGLFRYGPNYDFPAIVAYFSTIPASIYFITLFETSFSEKYQKYFYLLGHSGSLEEVNNSREEMINTIRTGIKKITYIQLLTCLFFITIGAKLLAIMNIGMTEIMLDTFRMFCIGYSLYFIANTLVLLHLYFMNEKRIIVPTMIFAILTSCSSYISSKLLDGMDGVGFSLFCGVLVIIVGILLAKYLNKIEYYVFCEQSHNSANNKTSFDKRNLNLKQRMKYIIVSGILCIAIMVASMGSIINNVIKESNILVFTPEKSTAVLSSPGMGLAPWAESDETLSLNTTLVYVELKWSDWEPEEGVYDVDFVNEYYNLEQYQQEGRNVVFRFICDEPTEEVHMDIPEWLYNKIGEDGTWYDIDYGKGFSPNYENHTFIEEHGEAIMALGDSFGKDDFFIYVELGSLGHWGEWHVNYEKNILRIPEFAVREEYLKPYIDAFPNAMFLLRYPLIDAEKYGFGLYNDMTGDYDETLYWLQQMSGGIWEQTELEEQADCKETWKTKPIGGEFASSYDDSYFLLKEFEMTLESIMDSHQSFIGPKIIIDESETDYSKSMNKLLTTIGYRYFVESVSIDFNEKESFSITCSLGNDGIAPIYKKYEVVLSILDEDGNTVWNTEDLEFDLRELLPNENKSISCIAEKELFDDDSKYKLIISIQDETGKAVVPLALQNEIESFSYQIAEFSIK